MRKTFTALVAAFMIAAPAQASDECETMGELAELIMEYRQLGVDMSRVVDSVSTSISRRMVEDAYTEHRYNVEVLQKRVAREFGERWELKCYGAGEKDG